MLRILGIAAAIALVISGTALAQTAGVSNGVDITNVAIGGGGSDGGALRYGGSFRQDNNVPAPALSTFSTNPCTLPVGVVGSALGVSAGIAVANLDEGCDARADAAAWRGLGRPDVGIQRMIQRDANRRAWEAANGARVSAVPVPDLSLVSAHVRIVPAPAGAAPAALPADQRTDAAVAVRGGPRLYPDRCYRRDHSINHRLPGCAA